MGIQSHPKRGVAARRPAWQRGGDRTELRFRLGERDIRRQAPKDLDPHVGRALHRRRVIHQAVGRQRHPEQAVVRHGEATFRHADDRRGGATDPDRAADDSRVLVEPRGPENETDNDRWRAHVLFIGRDEWTAERHASASRREEPTADEREASRRGMRFRCGRPHGRGIREHGLDLHPRRTVAQVEELVVRPGSRHRAIGRPQHNWDAVRVDDALAAQGGIHDAERSRGDAQPQ